MNDENNNMSNEFIDIEKKGSKNYIVIVSILYLFVIVLSVFFVLGLMDQKKKIEDLNKDKNNASEIHEGEHNLPINQDEELNPENSENINEDDLNKEPENQNSEDINIEYPSIEDLMG